MLDPSSALGHGARASRMLCNGQNQFECLPKGSLVGNRAGAFCLAHLLTKCWWLGPGGHRVPTAFLYSLPFNLYNSLRQELSFTWMRKPNVWSLWVLVPNQTASKW